MKSKKRLLFTLLSFSMLLSMCACSGGKENRTTKNLIDAASISQSISAPQYMPVQLNYPETLWIENSLAKYENSIFYLANNNDKEFVCAYEIGQKEPVTLFSITGKSLTDITVSDSGEIFVLTHSTEHDGSDSILRLDTSGDLIAEYNLEKLKGTDRSGNKALEFANGRLYVLGSEYLTSVNIGTELKEEFKVGVQNDAIMTASKEQIVLGQSKENQYQLLLLNDRNHDFSEISSLNIPFMRLSGGISHDIYLDDGKNLYSLNFEDKSFEKLFSWNGLSLISGAVFEYEAGKFISTAKVSSDNPCPILTLSKVSDNSNRKDTIILATTGEYLDYRIQNAIREWNIKHPECVIEIKDYSVYAGGSDTRAAEMKLAADILAGDMPDIFDFSLNAIDTIPSAASYARKGLLENLYPYIDNDPNISRDDFFPSVLNSLEINGGLYEITPEISLLTSFSSRKIVGDESQWNYEHFTDLIAQNDNYTTLFNTNLSRSFLFGNILNASGAKLVDWTKGEAYFTSDYFINMLTMLKAQPEPEVESIEPKLQKRISSNQGLLYMAIVDDPLMVSAPASPNVFGKDYCFVGIPEIGSSIYPNLSYGICAYSQNKDKCWEFLSQFVSRENSSEFYMSPRKEAVENQIKNSWKRISDVAQSHPYAQQAVSDFLGVLQSADTVYRHDPQIWRIVFSEANAYFAGDKSAEQVAENIQSRVSIYLAEQG